MKKIICPSCEKVIMSVGEAENLLRKTSSKILFSHCVCGEGIEIRSLQRDVFKISTSSGNKLVQVIKD